MNSAEPLLLHEDIWHSGHSLLPQARRSEFSFLAKLAGEPQRWRAGVMREVNWKSVKWSDGIKSFSPTVWTSAGGMLVIRYFPVAFGGLFFGIWGTTVKWPTASPSILKWSPSGKKHHHHPLPLPLPHIFLLGQTHSYFHSLFLDMNKQLRFTK